MSERETWPNDYREPDFINYPCNSIHFPRPTSGWHYAWTAVFWTVVVVGMVLLSDEARGVSRLTIELVLFPLGGLSMIGWAMTYSGVGGSSPQVLYDRLLEQTALSESLQRRWNNEELVQLERHVEWGMNAAENRADEVWRKRKSTWFRRVFWRWVGSGDITRPALFLWDELKYSAHLLREARQRRYEAERALKLLDAQMTANKEAEKAALFGDAICAAQEEAVELLNREIDHYLPGWTEIHEPLRNAAMKAIDTANAVALSLPEVDRLATWKATWWLHWKKARNAGCEIKVRTKALMEARQKGWQFENGRMERGIEKPCPEPGDLHEIEKAHERLIEACESALTEAALALRALSDH